jgi:hypothetical protein
MNPKEPPTIADFGDQLAELLCFKPTTVLGVWLSARGFAYSHNEIARLVLDNVDAYRAAQRGADEPAESAHR